MAQYTIKITEDNNFVVCLLLYITIIPQERTRYKMIDSQQGV